MFIIFFFLLLFIKVRLVTIDAYSNYKGLYLLTLYDHQINWSVWLWKIGLFDYEPICLHIFFFAIFFKVWWSLENSLKSYWDWMCFIYVIASMGWAGRFTHLSGCSRGGAAGCEWNASRRDTTDSGQPGQLSADPHTPH